MGIQVISRDGQPEYAVVPWEQYQALLQAAGQAPAEAGASEPAPAAAVAALPAFSEVAQIRQARASRLSNWRAMLVSPAYLAMIESGERHPDAAIRRALAWHLGSQAGASHRARSGSAVSIGTTCWASLTWPAVNVTC